MNTKRALINSVLGLGIVAVAVTGWATIGKAAPAPSSTTSVVTAETGNVLSSVSGTGNVIVPTQLAVNFDAAVSSAKITRVLAKVGDTVTAGQPLAKVDDTLTAQALATAQAQLVSAQASLDKAQNAVTPAIVAQDAASANQASLAVSNARAAVANAQNTLATDQVLQTAAVAQAQQSLNDAEAKTTQDVSNQQATVTQAQSQLDADNAALSAAQQDPTATPSAVSDARAAVAKDTQALQAATEAQQSLGVVGQPDARAGEQQPDQRPERRRGQAQLRSGGHRQRRPSGSDCQRLVPIDPRIERCEGTAADGRRSELAPRLVC